MEKTTLRSEMRAIDDLPPDSESAVVDGLFAWLSGRLPGTISGYLAMPGEVDLEPLLLRLPGWRWILPRVEEDGSLTFRDVDAPRERHPFGMEQPADSGPIVPVAEIDVLLVPGLAFDLRGDRLGNGAGHYDRVLSGLRSGAETIGIAPAARVVEEVPIEPHDQRVRWLATEQGVIRCHPSM
ncbi:MAG: 5-formyltetrahydrofolate cyclo-ligase [Acidimicrobiia bacterium]